MSLKKEYFGEMPDGREVSLYTITNKNGLEASITDLGAVWVRMVVPDKNGGMDDVMLGFDDAAGYLNNGPHFGSVVGRIANRTAKGKFSLNGKEYTLAVNNGPNNLHSGLDYYDARLWNAKEEAENAVTFTLLSPDGDQGYPGNAIVSVTYTLTDEDMLTLTYRVLSDADTPVNLTNHGYFNLLGNNGGSILDHKARILADFYTPSDETSIPTGEIRPVKGTPMDFTDFHVIGIGSMRISTSLSWDVDTTITGVSPMSAATSDLPRRSSPRRAAERWMSIQTSRACSSILLTGLSRRKERKVRSTMQGPHSALKPRTSRMLSTNRTSHHRS